jgi:hypothetical protein
VPLEPIREAKAAYTLCIEIRVRDTDGLKSLPETGIGAMGGIDCTQKDAWDVAEVAQES